MKTNADMVRPMGDLKVIQRTKDGMFNATDLLKQWNAMVLNTQNSGYVKGAKNQSVIKPQNSGYLKPKDLDDFFAAKGVKDFIEALVEEEKLNGENSPYLATRGKHGGTWMHPYLFIKFAMWLNPKFEVQVIKFIYDQMIKYRNEAGDAYRDMSSAIAKIVPSDFMPTAMKKTAEAINYVVFNDHEKLIRNKQGEEDKMQRLCELEKQVAMLINRGFIRDFPALLEYLRDEYKAAYLPPVFKNAV